MNIFDIHSFYPWLFPFQGFFFGFLQHFLSAVWQFVRPITEFTILLLDISHDALQVRMS